MNLRKALSTSAWLLGAIAAIGLFAQESVSKLEWATMRELNYRTGKITPNLKKMDGTSVKVPGFMVPLEDDEDKVVEFLLVPYVGACIHTPPPPPNQIVHVTMGDGKKTKVSFWDPVWVIGKLEIKDYKSPFGDVSFQIKAQKIEPYTEK
ncbi:hypothetical protein F183_A40850 [Bryobacterales bacterium F-183]|nr:hypothetical protein F183_A40850 [Bryobacterales bacterium F-183]